jgi:membrane fusion protein, heavy metal efflux system
MSFRLQVAESWLLKQGPTALVLCGLLALGVWGHLSEWKLPSFSALLGGKEKESDKSKASEDDNKDPASLTLSDGGAANAGLEDAPASPQTLAEHVEAPAVLAFDHIRHAQISPRVIGTAWRVLRHEGEDVKQGDLLALLASDTVGTAKAELLTSWIQHEIRVKMLQRLQTSADAVPERAVREAELNLREAKVRLVNSQQALVNLGLTLHLKDLNKLSDDEVANKVRLLGLPTKKEHPEKESMSSHGHEKDIDLTNEKDLPGNLLPLVAPFDGLVIRHDLNIGEVVGPTQIPFVVSDVRKLSVMMDVRQEDALRLQPGQTVAFRANATNQTAVGILKWISAEVDAKTRTVRARADIHNPGQRLRPATFGRASIKVLSKGALTVPDNALQWDGKSHRVFVRVDDNTYDPRVALLGARASGRTELLDNRALQAASLVGGFASSNGPLPGLASLAVRRRMLREVRPGERVVTTGSHVLKSELLKNRIGGED